MPKAGKPKRKYWEFHTDMLVLPAPVTNDSKLQLASLLETTASQLLHRRTFAFS